jgi:hypothetical protein
MNHCIDILLVILSLNMSPMLAQLTYSASSFL